MNIVINKDWKEKLSKEFSSDYFKKISDRYDKDKKDNVIFPSEENIFAAFNYTPYEDVKVVIIGQDPYHGEGEAHGLCFSVNKDIKIPPSLKNIYKELQDDLNCYIPNNGYLEKWAREGVLLLNNSLTVIKDKANSHSKIGWDKFTDDVIRLVNEKNTPVVFILWGNFAKSKKELITNPKHLVLEGAHPSPLSAYHGFFGCKHFSKTNEFLKKNGLKEIDWQIENI